MFFVETARRMGGSLADFGAPADRGQGWSGGSSDGGSPGKRIAFPRLTSVPRAASGLRHLARARFLRFGDEKSSIHLTRE
jgi:hypothetical protein